MAVDQSSIALALKGTWEIFKGVKEAVALIPDPVQKAKALTELALLQQQLAAKDVEIAKSIGYELCLAHAPIPGIMVDTGDEWKCTMDGCKRTKPTEQGHYKDAERIMRQSGGSRIGTPHGY
jgi:hypothetical protein